MILELRDICKTYIQGKMEVPVLKNVSLSVEEGEYLAIMGPSGSGKTTLMNVIGCLDTPTSGEYYLEGRDLSGESDLVLSRARLHSIGFVFQSFHLLPRQSALENVALPLLYAGVRKKERLERARHALERVGLGDRMNFKPTQLSGGQCQRVAIARAIVNNPKILLADEPTGALDTASGEQIMEVFERLNNEGVTIVMITHEQQIASHAQRILYIRDGQLTDMPGRFSTAAQKIAPAAQELAPVAQVPEEAVSDDIAEETPAESVRKPLPVVIVHPFEKEEEKISPEERSSEEALSELSLNKAESTDTFLDTEISALLDNGGESRDAGENIPEQVSAESIPLAVPAEESAEEAPSEETPTLVDRPTKSGAPAQISFDIWADPKEEFDTAAAEFTEEVELEATEKPVEKSSVKEKKSTRKKSATLVEIEDINVGFDTGEPETAAPAQEEKPVEEPKKNLKNSPSENSRKKSAKLVEIEDINVGFDTGEPETVAPAQEEKPAEEPKKSLKNSPSQNSRKKSAKLVEIEDINVGFDTDEPETAAPAQEEKPVEEPKKHLKNSPSQNSRKKSAKLVEIEDINVGFDTGEPETAAPAQEAVEVPKKSLKNSPSQNSRKKSAKLVEIEDINVGFDTGEPETVGTQTLPAQEEKPVEEPKKNLKNSPSQNSWKKSAKLVEIEDINVGFDTGEPKAVEMATPSAQEEKPAEEPKKSLKNSPSENSRKKSAKLVEIEDINVGFDTGEPETTVSVQQDHSADTPVEKPKKKAALIEIEDINVEFDSEE